MTSFTMEAPAKLNLGLAVTGRRADGYHDLVTIFQAVTIVDVLTFTSVERGDGSGPTHFTCSDPSLETPDNLVLQAVDLVRSHSGRNDRVHISLEKAIPAAAGLGGASSDAAATLLGLDGLWGLGLDRTTLHDMALNLGSDVPFFLKGGCAMAAGRGERLSRLANDVDLWFVVVTPALSSPIPRKTASLFAVLEPDDWRDGGNIVAQAKRIESGLELDPDLLGNSFERALYGLRPELELLREAFTRAGAPFVALSGSGPTHYTAVPTQDEAQRIETATRSLYSGEATSVVCTRHRTQTTAPSAPR